VEELIHLATVERVIVGLAIGLPVAGLLLGLGWGARSGQARTGAVQGLMGGLLGPLIWLLWRVYNGIEDHYGLDSVRALLLNLALFAAVGITGGILWARLRRQASDARRQPDQG
jgi:hypothetical protein